MPPVTANYTFYVRGDDHVTLYLSTTSSPENKTRIAYTGGYKPRYLDAPHQTSEMLFLQAGQRYHTDLVHREYGGGDFFEVAMRIHGVATSALEQQLVSIREVQAIEMTSNVVREEQTITFAGVTGGTFRVKGDKSISNEIKFLTKNGNALANAVEVRSHMLKSAYGV